MTEYTSLYTFCDENEIPEEFFCPICCCVLSEPITTSCCQIMFCKKCVAPVNKCPICSNPNLNFFPPPKYVTNKIKSLHVICNLCNMQFVNSVIINHIDGCIKSRSSTCSGKSLGCKFVGSESDVQKHEDKCFYIIGKDFIEKYNEDKKLLISKINELQQEIKELKKSNNNNNNNNNTISIPESISQCIDQGICTLSLTGREYKLQELYKCKTCNYTDSLCVCKSCAMKCHKGHELTKSQYSSGFCDCGLNQNCCKTVIQTKPKNYDIVYKEMKSLEDCYKFNVCTFLYTKKDFVHQIWYECITCGLVNHSGCCISCVNRCHRGHNIKQKIRNSLFFCDCYNSGHCTC